MSNQVTPISQVLPAFTPEQMSLITSTIAKGATPDELKLFLYRCQNLGLDPLKPGQIYFIKYGSGPGTIVVGIEGFRARAGKTGKLSGIKRGALKDDKGALIGAFAEVYRSDWKECAREEVPLAEYNTGKGNWAKMPETMIKKVAEAAALRMAFPDDLGGVYTQEEMEQAAEGRGAPRYQNTLGNGDGVIPPSKASMIERGTYAKWDVKDLNLEQLQHKKRLIEESEKPTTEDLQTLDQINQMIETHLNMEPVELEKTKISSARVAIPRANSATSQDQSQGALPMCCGRQMMISLYANEQTGNKDFYCKVCKNSKPRQQ